MHTIRRASTIWCASGTAVALHLAAISAATAADPVCVITDLGERISIATPTLEAAIRRSGYVSGIEAGTLLDRKSGFRDAGFGLDIVDWIMEPGSDEAYRDQLPKEMVYQFGNLHHGDGAKRSIEGPQICTQAKQVDPLVFRGRDFTGVTMRFNYQTAAPGKKTGSLWQQSIVFPDGKRYFISKDKITSVNDGAASFLRLDMPGHIKHKGADTFSEIYLSYHGTIPAAEFDRDFKPEAKFHYLRGKNPLPQRFIRAYHLRDPKTGKPGPWLAGMTLDPEVVTEGWCHERGYVCMIEEFGGRPIKAGESFSAAFIVGFFDSIEEMHAVYDQYRGHTDLDVTPTGWKLLK